LPKRVQSTYKGTNGGSGGGLTKEGMMKMLPVITIASVLACQAHAQEIYKWEDEKGVIHYSEKAAHPAAAPLKKDAAPYSHTGSLPPESPAEEKARIRRETEEARAGDTGRQPRPSPGLTQPKARLDPAGALWLSGAVRNSGKGICESPAVEVVVFDDNGSVDGSFETAAFPNEIARGQQARFEGKYFAPVGNSLSWDAIPRCDSAEGIVYGAHKSGTLSLKRSRTLRVKKLKTK
jgi:hypothetical protein